MTAGAAETVAGTSPVLRCPGRQALGFPSKPAVGPHPYPFFWLLLFISFLCNLKCRVLNTCLCLRPPSPGIPRVLSHWLSAGSKTEKEKAHGRGRPAFHLVAQLTVTGDEKVTVSLPVLAESLGRALLGMEAFLVKCFCSFNKSQRLSL